VRRKFLKALSLVLGAAISPTVGAQENDPRACEYGIPPMNIEPEVAPEPLPPPPVYGIPPIVPIELRGQVISAGRGKPIRGVRVSGGGQQVFTDRDGVFDLRTHIREEQLGNTECFPVEDVDGRRNRGRFVDTELCLELGELGSSPVVELERE
jgi:hypothetical protein